MIYTLLVISGMLFVLWIIGVEAQHVEDAGAGRTAAICLTAGHSTARATAATTNGNVRRGR